MPIRPPPMTFRCPSCGWKKTTHPKSDALIIGIDCFTCCPQCGREDILQECASLPETALERLKRLLCL